MILSKNTSNIGYLSKSLLGGSKEMSCGEFLDSVNSHLLSDSSRGLKLSCIEIPANFVFPDFSSTDDQGESDSFLSLTRMIRSGQRIFFYLPNYFFLGSQIPEVVERTKEEIVKISGFLELVGVSYRSIGIRIGSAYGARKVTMDRFCREVKSLSQRSVDLLTVFNDEKPSLFSVTDLLSGIYYDTRIPITFKFLAHSFNSGGLSYREAIFLSSSTWEDSCLPLVIHSESSEVDDNGVFLSPIPSEYLCHRIPTFGLSFDCAIESSMEAKSCIKYMSECNSLKPMVINKTGAK